MTQPTLVYYPHHEGMLSAAHQAQLTHILQEGLARSGLEPVPDYLANQLAYNNHHGVLEAMVDRETKGVAVVDHVVDDSTNNESLLYVDKLVAQGQGTALLTQLVCYALDVDGYVGLRTSSEENAAKYAHIGEKLKASGVRTVSFTMTEDGVSYTGFVFCDQQKQTIPQGVYEYIKEKPKSVRALQLVAA